jgi:hypothetical protein
MSNTRALLLPDETGFPADEIIDSLDSNHSGLAASSGCQEQERNRTVADFWGPKYNCTGPLELSLLSLLNLLTY